MYASAAGSRHRKAESDPGFRHPYVVHRPPSPAHQDAERTAAGMPYPLSPSRGRSPSIERVGNPNSPSGTTPSTPVSTRPPSPLPRSGHRRSSSRQGSIRVPPGGTWRPQPMKEVPQPHRSTSPPAPHRSLGREQSQLGDLPVRAQSPPSSSEGMQREGVPYMLYEPPPPSPRQGMSAMGHRSGSHHHRDHRHSHHHSHHHPQPSTTHHIHHRSARSRQGPPSAASHRYATTLTQPVYGHGSSAASSASRTSLNGGVTSRGNHRATSPTPVHGVTMSDYQGTGISRTPSVSSQRSRSHSHSRAPSPVIPAGVVEPHATHRLEISPPSPLPAATEIYHALHRPRPLAASEIYRNPHRPPLPANYDGQTQTPYVNMLLALDDISAFYNVLSAFFTWVLLVGFVLLPGAFSSNSGIIGVSGILTLVYVNHLTLYIVAFFCVGFGALGMIWLWWRWHGNYVWITNRIFIPGFFNSISGLISALSSIYGVQGGFFGKAEKSAIIATTTSAVICGILVVVYEHWLLRNLRLEHDEVVGVELPGKYGAGVLGEKLRDDQNGGA